MQGVTRCIARRCTTTLSGQEWSARTADEPPARGLRSGISALATGEVSAIETAAMFSTCSLTIPADCFAVTEKEKHADNSIWTREKCLYCGRYLTAWNCMFALA